MSVLEEYWINCCWQISRLICGDVLLDRRNPWKPWIRIICACHDSGWVYPKYKMDMLLLFQTISSEMGILFSCTYLGFVLCPFSEPVKGLEPASSWATGVLLLVLHVVDTIECWWYRFIISSWKTGAGSWCSKSLSYRAMTFFLFWYLKFTKNFAS